MPDTKQEIESWTEAGYRYGFSSDIDTDVAPPGLTEDCLLYTSDAADERVRV